MGHQKCPDGRADPRGPSADPALQSKGNLNELQTKEIKNGRLAMIACLGFAAQHAATGQSPLAALGAHLANPFTANFATNVSDQHSPHGTLSAEPTRLDLRYSQGWHALFLEQVNPFRQQDVLTATAPFPRPHACRACPCPWRKQLGSRLRGSSPILCAARSVHPCVVC